VSNGYTCDECGLTDRKNNLQIVGGKPANEYSWPAQVLIIQNYKYNRNNQTFTIAFQCGGTLIDRFTVISAAHCIVNEIQLSFFEKMQIVPNEYYPTYESMFTIYAGIYNISFHKKRQPVTYPGVKLDLEKIISHENYDRKLFRNDISIFRLASPVVLNRYVKLACLPSHTSNNYPPVDSACFASGWGTLTQGGPTPDVLYNVKLSVLDPSACQKYSDYTAEPQVCAGNVSGGHDTCQGDSGGGLYVHDILGGKKRYIVAGVVSYGMGCAEPGYPGIYSRTSYYLDWIKSHMIPKQLTQDDIVRMTLEEQHTPALHDFHVE
jgi:secreted trypsin-like serine protease